MRLLVQQNRTNMTTSRKAIIDLDTGEIEPGLPVEKRPPRVRIGRNYVMLFFETAEKAATDPTLQGNDLRLFLKLLSQTQYENALKVNPKKLAEELGIARPHIYRSLTRLKTAGLIDRNEHNEWSFPLTNLWRGSPEALAKARTAKLKAHSERNRKTTPP